MRLFYAIKLPEGIKKSLSEYSRQYEGISGIKTIDKDLLHITLLFLGETKEGKLNELDDIAQKISEKDFSTKIELDVSGVFPNRLKPRIIWIGSRSSNERLINLFNTMRKSHNNFITKQKADFFVTHITVCRIKKVDQSINIHEFNNSLELDIEGFSLFQSILTPQGPIYKQLKSYKFKRS